jgi:hypothetical protein
MSRRSDTWRPSAVFSVPGIQKNVVRGAVAMPGHAPLQREMLEHLAEWQSDETQFATGLLEKQKDGFAAIFGGDVKVPHDIVRGRNDTLISLHDHVTGYYSIRSYALGVDPGHNHAVDARVDVVFLSEGWGQLGEG